MIKDEWGGILDSDWSHDLKLISINMKERAFLTWGSRIINVPRKLLLSVGAEGMGGQQEGFIT